MTKSTPPSLPPIAALGISLTPEARVRIEQALAQSVERAVALLGDRPVDVDGFDREAAAE